MNAVSYHLTRPPGGPANPANGTGRGTRIPRPSSQGRSRCTRPSRSRYRHRGSRPADRCVQVPQCAARRSGATVPSRLVALRHPGCPRRAEEAVPQPVGEPAEVGHARPGRLPTVELPGDTHRPLAALPAAPTRLLAEHVREGGTDRTLRRIELTQLFQQLLGGEASVRQL